MGKDLNGKELGKNISHQRDGLYRLRITINGERKSFYDRDINALKLLRDEIIKEKKTNCKNISKKKKIVKMLKEDSPLHRSGFVYFITDGEFVKIGVADNVEKRLKELQTGNPKELTVVRSVYCENPYYAEKLFHDLFRYKRVNGEWFKIDNIHKIIGCL